MQTADDFEMLMSGIVGINLEHWLFLAEMKLRSEIAKLQEYIRMGITTIKEGNEYEKHRAARVEKHSFLTSSSTK